MSLSVAGALTGGLVGAGFGSGCWLVGSRLLAHRRPQLSDRVLAYLRDLPQVAGWREAEARSRSGAAALVWPALRWAAATLERVLGGSVSVQRKLDRANSSLNLRDFRVAQVVWGLAAFTVAAGFSAVVAVRSPGRTVPLLVLCGVAFVLGALLRENRLTAAVAARERRVLTEFPTIAELLALAVAAGEGPTSALDRVVRSSHGELSGDLARVLADTRTGTPLTRALEAMAARSGLPVVARFADGMAVALQRGTPLADVLHAQADDVRESGRRALIESGARREVAMMVPVVFLILPTTVTFAFWPGLVGLHLVTP